jgi:hypothetical protein
VQAVGELETGPSRYLAVEERGWGTCGNSCRAYRTGMPTRGASSSSVSRLGRYPAFCTAKSKQTMAKRKICCSSRVL